MTNTIVRNSFFAVVYRACNITHTIENTLLRFLSAKKTFFRWFYVYMCLYFGSSIMLLTYFVDFR